MRFIPLTFLMAASVFGATTDKGSGKGGGSGDGIPTVDQIKEPLCKPWVAVRDAIMGGLFNGNIDLSTYSPFQTENLTTQDAATTTPAPRSASSSTTLVSITPFEESPIPELI